MRTLYINDTHHEVFFNDGSMVRSYTQGIPKLMYGEIPKEKEFVHHLSGKNCFYELANAMSVDVIKNPFTKKEYIDDSSFPRKIYKNEIKNFSFIRCYKEIKIENVSIDRLLKDLNFNDFTLLMFDRENELKYLYLENECFSGVENNGIELD